MVSFSSEDKASLRSFKGVEEVVAGNKRAYAARMGYDLINADDLVDHSRPPAWSKIPAVRSRLSSYDWIFWNDAVCALIEKSKFLFFWGKIFN